MKISFLCTDQSLQRGSERITAALANALVKNEEVSIISLYRQHKNVCYKIESGVQTKALNKGNRIGFWPVKFFQKVAELWGVAQQIKKNDQRIWIGVGAYCSILLGMFGWLNRTSKYIAWEHSSYQATKGKWRKLRKIFYKKLNAIVCLNSTEQQYYQQEFKQVFVIPNFIGFHTTQKSTLVNKVFLSVGALEEEKGFDLLIEAFYYCKADDWTLQIIGSGSKQMTLEALILKYNLQDRVQIFPFTENIETAYQSAGIYVLPSKSEAFGMVLIEAMDGGLPCIAFDCPTGPRHIIKDQVNGILVPAENIHLLAKAMNLLSTNHHLAERLVEEGKASLSAYGLQQILKSWYLLFNNLYN